MKPYRCYDIEHAHVVTHKEVTNYTSVRIYLLVYTRVFSWAGNILRVGELWGLGTRGIECLHTGGFLISHSWQHVVYMTTLFCY